MNVFTRNIHARDDSTLPGPTSGNGETASVPTTASTLAGSSAANNNNQNWRKTLLANFQKNSRNMPTAKIFQSRHAAAPVPVVNPDVPASQPVKPERTNILSGTINERAFQVSDTAPPIPFFMRKSAESLRLNRQENSSNNNNNVERSSSLQVSPTAFSSSPAATNHPTTTASPPVSQSDEAVKNKEASNGESNLHVPIPIPSALISTKPSVSAEQQRAIITRVKTSSSDEQSRSLSCIGHDSSRLRQINRSQTTDAHRRQCTFVDSSTIC